MREKDFFEEKPKKKKTMVAFFVFLSIILLSASFYFIFFSSGRIFVKNGLAIVKNAFEDTLGGGANGDFSAEIDIQGATTTATSSNDAYSSLTEEDATGIFPSEEQITTTSTKKSKATAKQKAATTSDDESGDMNTTTDASTNQNSDSQVVNEENNSPNDSSTAENIFLPIAVTQTTSTENNSLIAAPTQCTVSTSTNSSPLQKNIILNEVAWMGSPPLPGESGTSASEREWIELKNISGTALVLAGWRLLDSGGNIFITFSSTDIIAAGGFFLLERGANAVPDIPADRTYSGALPNGGDALFLFDANCAMRDSLNASSLWPGGDNTTKQTLERNADGGGWHTSVSSGGTPRAENSVPVISSGNSVTVTPGPPPTPTPTPAPTSTPEPTPPPTPPSPPPPDTASSTCSLGHILIVAVQIAGASSTNDFIQLANPTTATVDMTGWKLRKKSSGGTDSSLRTFGAGSVIAANGYFVWANSAGGFASTISANASSTETLAADNSVALMDASGTIIDEVAWGTGIDQYVEASAYPTDPTANQVLTRISSSGVFVDTDNNANDFTIQ